MSIARRIFLFLAVNLLVVVTLSLVLNIFHVQPFLAAHGIDYKALLIFCLIWGMGGAFISLSLSRVMAKWLMRVKIINPNTTDMEDRRLLNIVYELARGAKLSVMPQVGIYDSPEVNAFATGPTRKRALVAVSRGLLDKMSNQEIEGVLAHEVSHITNGDMVTMTLLQGIVNAFVMFLARILAYAFSGLGKSRDESSSGSYFSYIMMVYLFEFVFMLLGSMVTASYSRFREFRADRGGAKLAGKEKMIAALESLLAMQKNTRSAPAAETAAAFQALKISTKGRPGFLTLFASHPPLEKRIARLRGISV